MIVIHIKDHGLFFNFKGKQYRTPVELKIHDRNLNELLFSLKKSEVSQFEILKNPEIEEEMKPQENNKKEDNKNLELNSLLNQINNKLNMLENFIKQSPDKTIHFEDEEVKKIPIKKKNINDPVEEFIPKPILNFESKIKNTSDSSKIDFNKIEETSNRVGRIKFKKNDGGFSK